MSDSCKYVYAKLVPEKGAVAVETVIDGPSQPTKLVVQHVLGC